MQKKILALGFFFVLSIILYAQPSAVMLNEKLDSFALPFEQIVKMSHQEMLDAGFKFKKSRNLYVLRSYSQTTKENRLSLNNSRTYEDFEAFVYMGKKGKAIIQICFYNPFIYAALEQWIYHWYGEPYRLTGPKMEMYEFKYDKYKIRLMQNNAYSKRLFFYGDNNGIITSTFYDSADISATVAQVEGLKKDYYPIYIYTVFTGEEVHSKWLQRRQRQLEIERTKNNNLEDLI